MLDRVLSAKLREYAPSNAVEQDNVLQEMMQHYVLTSLSRAGLFAEAIFHGGTCLRIVNGINRFSEDLDFLLKRPAPAFRWQGYLESAGRPTVPPAARAGSPQVLGCGVLSAPCEQNGGIHPMKSNRIFYPLPSTTYGFIYEVIGEGRIVEWGMEMRAGK